MKGFQILKSHSPVILSETFFVSRRTYAISNVILSEAFFAERRTCGSHRAARRFLPRNKREATFLILPVLLLLASLASAQTLTGTVKNGTTGKPAGGDEVVLLSLGQGMEEAGRTKADAKGNFSFKLDGQGPHLVRVIHQEVTYHRMAPPGTTSVEVQVYDVGKKVEGIEVVADIMRFQAGNGQLQVERTFAVNNNSKPPRTQMNEHNLEFYVPDGASITEAQAMTAGGQPVKSAPVPEGANAKNKYAFLFPLRPGETRFNVIYTVPYTGSVNIDPKSVYPLEHFVAIAPKSMEFSAAPGATFQIAPYPGQPDANVEVASNAGTRPGSGLQTLRRRHAGRARRRRPDQFRRLLRAERESPRRRPRPSDRRSRSPPEISLVDSRRLRRSPHRRRNLRSLASTGRQPRRPLQRKGPSRP